MRAIGKLGNITPVQKLMLMFVAIFGFMALAMPHLAVAADDEPPYWASIKAEKAYMRVGPDQSYQISWVYKRKGLPIKILKKRRDWRMVEDPAGTRGWIHVRLLSNQRTGLVTGEIRGLMSEPSENARVIWRVEPGVVGKLSECASGWCLFDVKGRAGWIRTEYLWGTAKP